MQVRTFWLSNCCSGRDRRVLNITLHSDCPTEIDFDISQSVGSSSQSRDLDFDTAAKRRDQGIIPATSTSSGNDGVLHSLLQQDLQQSKYQRDRQAEGIRERGRNKLEAADDPPKISGGIRERAISSSASVSPSPMNQNDSIRVVSKAVETESTGFTVTPHIKNDALNLKLQNNKPQDVTTGDHVFSNALDAASSEGGNETDENDRQANTVTTATTATDSEFNYSALGSVAHSSRPASGNIYSSNTKSSRMVDRLCPRERHRLQSFYLSPPTLD